MDRPPHKALPDDCNAGVDCLVSDVEEHSHIFVQPLLAHVLLFNYLFQVLLIKGCNGFGTRPSYVAGPDVAEQPRRTLPRVGAVPDGSENSNRWCVVGVLEGCVVHALTTCPQSTNGLGAVECATRPL